MRILSDLPSSQERLCILVQTRKSISCHFKDVGGFECSVYLEAAFFFAAQRFLAAGGNAGASFGRENPLLLLW